MSGPGGWLEVAHHLLHLPLSTYPVPGFSLALLTLCLTLAGCALSCCCFSLGVVVGSAGPGAIAATALRAIDGFSEPLDSGSRLRRRALLGAARPQGLPAQRDL